VIALVDDLVLPQNDLRGILPLSSFRIRRQIRGVGTCVKTCSLEIGADGCHGRTAVGIRASINALQERAFGRDDSELAIIRLHDLAQLLIATLGTDA
jgi:hypothetical protein